MYMYIYLLRNIRIKPCQFFLSGFFSLKCPNTPKLCTTNISRKKDYKVMKFCQLIEYYMRNIFLEKLCIKCGKSIV